MTATGTSTAATPPAPGTGGGGLPPTLPPGFDSTPIPATTTGGGGAAANPTQPATAGTSTSFTPQTADTTAGGPKFIPAPGGCTTPPDVPPGKEPPGKDPVQGGGPTGDLKPILEQLTQVIGKLQTAVGGVSGGGAPGKTPEQAPPGKTPAQDATQGGGQVAGANGGGPGGKVAGANGAGAADPMANCNMPGMGGKDSTKAGGPSSGSVAGANGSGAADASKAGSAVQGANGGGPVSNDALVQALQGVISALNALVAALGGVAGGGPGGKTPEQTPPGKDVPTPPGKDLPPTKDLPPPPGNVAGDNGPGQKPDQVPVQGPPPTKAPDVPPPPTDVAGDQGPGQKPDQVPTQSPVQGPPPKPTEVSPANGGPKPEQKPEQKPPTPEQKPPAPPTVAKGNVVLDNKDGDWSAKLTAKGKGKDGDSSVELWGDPHVRATIDGKEQKFDIGYGAGSVTLASGTIITWNTYPKGAERQFILKDFNINSPGTKFDQKVTTSDKKDELNLETALNEDDLKEFFTALSTMKGDWNKPLQNGTWVSPKYTPAQNPGQVTQQ